MRLSLASIVLSFPIPSSTLASCSASAAQTRRVSQPASGCDAAFDAARASWRARNESKGPRFSMLFYLIMSIYEARAIKEGYQGGAPMTRQRAQAMALSSMSFPDKDIVFVGMLRFASKGDAPRLMQGSRGWVLLFNFVSRLVCGSLVTSVIGNLCKFRHG